MTQKMKIIEQNSNGKVIAERGIVDIRESEFNVTGDGTAGSLLIPATIFSSLQIAVRRKLVFRGMAALLVGPSGVPGSSLNINLQDEESIRVYNVAEGAEIPIDKETYTNRATTPAKFAVRVGITKEMVEDSQFDLMRFQASSAGYQLAKNEDSLVVTQLDLASTDSSNDVANSNATIAITDITKAMENLEVNNYTPTDIVVGAEVANDLRNIDTFTEADKSGINNPGQSLIGTIFGMRVTMSTAVSAKLAFVFDRSKSFALVEKRPVTLANWNDFARDTVQMTATQRVSAVFLYSKATSEITTL